MTSLCCLICVCVFRTGERSETEPEVLVWQGLAEHWTHVRPLFPGKLLPSKWQKDCSHSSAVRGRPTCGWSPQWPAAQNQCATVSDAAFSLFESIWYVLFKNPHHFFFCRSQTHPDLKLWRQPWKPTERSRMKSKALQDAKTVSSSSGLEAIEHKEAFSSSFQDYISSEHCYQKPQTLYQVLEPRLVLKTRVESLLEDRLHSTERVPKNEQHYNGEMLKTSSTQLFNHSKVSVTLNETLTALSQSSFVKYNGYGLIFLKVWK